MPSSAIVIQKTPNETKTVTLSLSRVLQTNESVTAVSVGSISPAGQLSVVPGTFSANAVEIILAGGADAVTYGVEVNATTDLGNVIPLLLAVQASLSIGDVYNLKNPEAVQALVDKINPGDSAVGNASFTFPVDMTVQSLQAGYVEWELLDSSGTTYSSGNAFDYKITASGLQNRVDAQAVISVPSDIPANIDGLRYQIRWKLTLPNSNNQTFFAFENVTVIANTSVPVGAESTVEIVGKTARVNVVLPKPYDNIVFEVYRSYNNEQLISPTVVDAGSMAMTSDGYFCSGYIDTSVSTEITASLDNYVVVWTYWNDINGSDQDSQTSDLYIVNPSILNAAKQILALINKAHTTLFGKADMIFDMPIVLKYLNMGKDWFNSSYGTLTNFSMVNATGGIRDFWIMCSSVVALRAQALAEGEKAFNFSGQAIQLDVDRSQYYQTLADNIQARLDNELKPFKQNLIKKGIVEGDGSLESISLRRGAVGGISITMSPVSPGFRYSGKLGGLLNR